MTVMELLHRVTAGCAWLVISACCVVSSGAAAEVDYERDIKPLLKNKCYACHGPRKQEAGLRLDAGRLAVAGSENGPVLVPGASAASLLMTRIVAADADRRMPPNGSPLGAADVEFMRSWIDAGAPFPADESIAPLAEAHWAFQPVRSVAPPSVNDASWPLNAIDHFVLARLEDRGWRPNDQAAPGALLRRVFLDVIGLPPSIEEQDAFLTAPTDAAYARVVRDLLHRPGYGERYARHWLDVVRYADSNGYERDAAKPEVWRYRDYVIRALNEDKPFDRFIVEQLAGDEIPDASSESIVAMGFNRLGPWDDEPADFAVDRYDQLDDIVNTTSQAFLGLTLGCARCHDHKFDPLTQRDYYSMVAVFHPLQRPQQGRTELTRYAAPPAARIELERRDREMNHLREQIATIRRNYRAAHLASGRSQFSLQVRDAFLAAPEARSDEQRRLVAEQQAELDAELRKSMPADLTRRIADHAEAIETLKEGTAGVAQAYYLIESSPAPPPTHVLVRGSPANPGDEVEPAVPEILVDDRIEFLAPGRFTSRRRATLAAWIASGDNRLTARVIVNRVWQWHFGAGLVRTPNDFGLQGVAPTHPELLDFLAHWFVHEAGWSLKELHYLILTSRTYQMSRGRRADYAAADPDNRLLSRRRYRRLEVEAIRDSMLFVSGQLSRQMYGPPMHPFIPPDALLNHADRESIWPAFDEAAASRRTVYAFVKRSLLVPLLEVLDFCDTTRTFPNRNVTTVPTQALTLYNGTFVNRQADHFASRLLREAGNDVDRQIERAWRLALCRPPTDGELISVRQFLAEEVEADNTADRPTKRRRAIVQMCRVLLNLNEFVYAE